MTKKAAEDVAPPAEEAALDPLAGLQPGRICHYWPRDYEARHCAPGPWAAIVSAVGALPGQATLHVLMPAPAPIGTDPVCRFQDIPFAGKPPVDAGTDHAWKEGKWTWPTRV